MYYLGRGESRLQEPGFLMEFEKGGGVWDQGFGVWSSGESQGSGRSLELMSTTTNTTVLGCDVAFDDGENDSDDE